MKRSMLVLAIAACAAVATPSTTSARLSDLTETTQAQPNYAQHYYGPYRRHVRRFIVEPTDVLTMDIHITMEDIIDHPITMEDIIIPTPMGDIIARPTSGLTNATMRGDDDGQHLELGQIQ